MDRKEEDLSALESLKLIRSMIESTKTSIGDHSHYYLLWGYAVITGCIIQYILLDIVNYRHHYYAWFVTPIALVCHFILLSREKNRERVKTFVSEANGHVWTILGLSFFVLFFVFSKIGWQYCYPFYILLYSVGTYISGSLIKFKPMRTGGMICMVLVAIAPYLQYPFQILLTAFAILISYIIPGHLLRNEYRKTNKTSYGK